MISTLLASMILVPFRPGLALASTDPYPSQGVGYDVSYPDCSRVIGPTASNGSPYVFAVIGVTGGKPFTNNGCLAAEYGAATSAGRLATLYMNTSGPVGSTARQYENLGPKACSYKDKISCAYNYGYQEAVAAYDYASSQGATSNTWWLDVETANSWTHQTSENVATIQGGVDALHALNVANVGVYSLPSMWSTITGSAQIGIPVWVAGASSLSTASGLCGASFTGGPVWLVQYSNASRSLDEDYAC